MSEREQSLSDAVYDALLAVRGDPEHVHVVAKGRSVYGSLTYHTPTHPEKPLHHAGLRAGSIDEIDAKVGGLVVLMQGLGLEPDGSNAETWTGENAAA